MAFFMGKVSIDVHLKAGCIGHDISKEIYTYLVDTLLGLVVKDKGIVIFFFPPEKKEWEVMNLDHFEATPSLAMDISVIFMTEVSENVSLAKVAESVPLGCFATTTTSTCFISRVNIPSLLYFDSKFSTWCCNSRSTLHLEKDSVCLVKIMGKTIEKGAMSCVASMMEPFVFFVKNEDIRKPVKGGITIT
jgi:hypothetical protein